MPTVKQANDTKLLMIVGLKVRDIAGHNLSS